MDDEENIIFEQYVGQADNPSSLYVKLLSEEPTVLAYVKPTGLYLSEGFSYASPMIAVSFEVYDEFGTYASVSKIDPETIYELHIGHKKEDTTVLPLRIAKVENKNTSAGKSNQLAFTITFVHSGWNELINVRRNRAWTETKYSDVVNEIATEVGFAEVNISPSKDKNNTVIQPYWSDLLMLKWIQERAVSTKYEDHYEFGCKLTGEFFFKSVSDLIDEARADAQNSRIPFLRLDGYNTEILDRNKEKEENFKSPTYFTDYTATEYYMDSVLNGAGGVEAMYYDFQTGQYVRNSKTVSNMKALQLSDWSAIKTSSESSKMKMMGGRDKEVVNKAISKISSSLLSTNQFSITTEGALDIHIGNMVEIAIPNQSEAAVNLAPYSVMYSGFYMVAGIHHFIPLVASGGIMTTMDLARHGFDGKDLQGYVTTTLGKFV